MRDFGVRGEDLAKAISRMIEKEPTGNLIPGSRVLLYVFRLKIYFRGDRVAELTRREELVLLAIIKLEENACIVTLRRHIKETIGTSINYGSLCNTLSALIRKGFARSAESNPEPRRGGRRKVLYSLTAAGRRALLQAYRIQELAWRGLAESIVKAD